MIIGQSKTRMTGNIVGKRRDRERQESEGKTVGHRPDRFESGHVRSGRPLPLWDRYPEGSSVRSARQYRPWESRPSRQGLLTPLSQVRRTICLLNGWASKLILDITAHEDSLCGNGSRFCPQYGGAQTLRAGEVHAGVCGSDALFSDQRGRHRSRSSPNTPKSRTANVNAYAIESESKAMERTLQVDPKGIELILALISKTVPQGRLGQGGRFYDARFFTELRESGFLKRLWGEKP